MRSPLAAISQAIADLEGTNPKPFRVHLRRLRILAAIGYRGMAWRIVGLLGTFGAVTFVLGIFELEDQAVPLLTGLFQCGIAAVLAWEQMRFELGDEERPGSSPEGFCGRRIRREESLYGELGQGDVDRGAEDGGHAQEGQEAVAGAEV